MTPFSNSPCNRTKSPNVPFRFQLASNDCAPACVMSIAEFYDIAITIKEIRRRLVTDPVQGTALKQFSTGLHDLFSVEIGRQSIEYLDDMASCGQMTQSHRHCPPIGSPRVTDRPAIFPVASVDAPGRGRTGRHALHDADKHPVRSHPSGAARRIPRRGSSRGGQRSASSAGDRNHYELVRIPCEHSLD